jgi:uncharacterized membrane protein
MNNPLTPTVSGQEKIAAALGSILFFIPIIMDLKTPYVIGYMKQGFAINILSLTCTVVSWFLWFLAPILGLLNFVLFLLSLFIAFQAYSAKEYKIEKLLDGANLAIEKLNIGNLFTPKK